MPSGSVESENQGNSPKGMPLAEISPMSKESFGPLEKTQIMVIRLIPKIIVQTIIKLHICGSQFTIEVLAADKFAPLQRSPFSKGMPLAWDKS